MNRRDTIIVAVLLNAAIIAVLLIMAVNTEEEVLYDRPSTSEVDKSINQVNQVAQVQQKPENTTLQQANKTVFVDLDEMSFDGLSNDFPSSSDDFFLVEEDLNIIPEKPLKQQNMAKEESPKLEMEGVKVVEVVVKKGDSLDKIARANGTTIEAIKGVNQLKTTNLSIGQKLKVPVGYKKSTTPATKETVASVDVKPSPTAKPQTSSAVEYYVVKSGDTPWKIAKEQRVSMEDILRLNQLNEEKARNLKIGDRIRIR